MEFSDIVSKDYNNMTEDIFGNKMTILKSVKSLRQLRRTEKELVRLNYKEAIIKGFTLKGIQQYIYHLAYVIKHIVISSFSYSGWIFLF